MAQPEAVFLPVGPRFQATDLARGPWDPQALHGGAPAALIMRALEQLPAAEDTILARVTYELLRPVPLAELTVAAEVARPGRRVQLLEASLAGPDGAEIVKARALRVRRSEAPAGVAATVGPGGEVAAPPGPEHGDAGSYPRDPDYVMFARGAMEIRFVAGEFGPVGPATAWFRLRFPLVAGEAPSPLQRLAAAADFPNGIGNAVSWEDYVFINPDLTISLEREPHGEWICLEAQTRIGAAGIGSSEAVLYDQRGRVGRAMQSLLVSRRAT